ncbi:hypothetical protein HID58_014569 [Brassica napus]|uniref:SWIM-type domain-containing protein n=2 Tax=Brassica TaxID=3705 RepID=A0ABQ8DHH7_BRANA|nr:hypothetical protein HID58_014569 [Brassica napus]
MGTLVRIVQGIWEKTLAEEWRFDENPAAEEDTLLINPHDSFEGLVEMIRIRLDLGVLTPVALTYQLPEWMLLPEGTTTPPVTLSTDRDVEVMLTVREYMTEPVMYVTSGPELVAKYQFLCRSPFKIGDRSFLGEGITEEQHHEAIKELVGGHPIVCSQSMLELLFNEPQLLIVYRVALEIDMVYAPTPEERAALPRLTVDDMIAIQDGDTIYIDEGRNHAPTEEVLHGEPIDVDNLHRAFPNLTPRNVQRHGIPLEVEPLNQIPSLPPIEEEVTEEHFDANGISEMQPNYEVNVTAAPPPTNGALGLPIGPNLRVNAPTTPTTVLVVHDDEASYTGSSDGLNNVDNNRGVAPPIPIGETVINISQALEQGCREDAAPIQNLSSAPLTQQGDGGTRTTTRNHGDPCLDLTLGLGMNNTSASKAIIEIEDSDSEADGDSGGNTSNNIWSFMLCEKKFRFRNTRSSPEGMVMECISGTCQWRVYATKMKTLEKFEVRKAQLQHTCSVDDRVGYERQATHGVIGELMKSRYVYPGAQHCACILHLKRNIRTYFKNKHLSRNVTNNGSGSFTPRVLEIIAGNFEQSGGMLASKINNFKYEVRTKEGESFHIYLSVKSCSCNVFQTLMISCSHAISAVIKSKTRVETLVSGVYSLECLATAYKDEIFPISNNMTGEHRNIGAVDMEVLPPATKRPPGRPRKSRILSTGEIRMKAPRKKHVCSRCKGSGHNRATCNVAI